MHIPCQFFKKLTGIKKNDVFLSATIELAQKMQNSFSIFVVRKERYCQTCHLYGKSDDMFAEKYFLFGKIRFRRVDLWLHKKSILIGGYSLF